MKKIGLARCRMRGTAAGYRRYPRYPGMCDTEERSTPYSHLFTFLILWKTRILRSLFQLKGKVDNKHCCNVVYEGICSCGTN